MSFPDIDAARRTDASFRNRTQEGHHKCYSKMEDLGIDMIISFPVSDLLHLIDSGVVKNSMIRWICGAKGYKNKWPKSRVDAVSDILIALNEQMPTDIHRSIRGLHVLKYWKGLEFKTFLLYIGMVVLRYDLIPREYNHFLKLVCAITICSCSAYKKYIPVAKDMLNAYIKEYINIYGVEYIGSNVHNLTHITEDMENLNVTDLNELSTYKFENCLRMIGLNIRTGSFPLAQIARRLIEASSQSSKFQPNKFNFFPVLEYEIKNAASNRFSKITVRPNLILSNRKFGDKWFLTEDEDIVKMKYVIKTDEKIQVCGIKIKQKGPFFSKDDGGPLNSTKLHIYISDGETEDTECMFELAQIKAKFVCLSYNFDFVFIPLLHTLNFT